MPATSPATGRLAAALRFARRNKAAVAGAAVLLAIVLLALAAPLLATGNPLSINSHRRLGFELLYALRVVRALGATWHRADPGEGTGLPASRGLGPWHGAAH